MDRFDNFDKNFNSIRRTAVVGSIVSLLIGTALTGAVAYVAWHFLQKVW